MNVKLEISLTWHPAFVLLGGMLCPCGCPAVGAAMLLLQPGDAQSELPTASPPHCSLRSFSPPS